MSSARFSIVERASIKVRQIRFRNKNNAPFLSGDSFASICDYVVESNEELEGISGKDINGATIFCRSDLLPKLLIAINGKGRAKTLVCGNSDFDFLQVPPGISQYFERAYLQNSLISDQKSIFTLPIGVENLDYGINGLPGNLRSSKSWSNRRDMILVGPFSPTHAERAELLKVCSALEVCEVHNNYHASPRQYSQLVNDYKYVAVPRGNGIDTHRFWEALYRGAIPIVKESEWSRSLRYLGIPFIEVKEWSKKALSAVAEQTELGGFEPNEIKSLWIDYWKERFAL